MRLPVPAAGCAKWLALACLLLVGCGPDKDSAADGVKADSSAPGAQAVIESAQVGERTWTGVLPCRDCQGIDSRLVLRKTERERGYVLSETYIGGAGENTFVREGSWEEVLERVDGETMTVYILDPDQGGQRYALQPDGALVLLDGPGSRQTQAIAYRLQRF
jgi:copper homeostasis protein (lipoprotein)